MEDSDNSRGETITWNFPFHEVGMRKRFVLLRPPPQDAFLELNWLMLSVARFQPKQSSVHDKHELNQFPLGPISFIFMQFSAKLLPKNRLTNPSLGMAALPSGEILYLPMEIVISTGIYLSISPLIVFFTIAKCFKFASERRNHQQVAIQYRQQTKPGIEMC